MDDTERRRKSVDPGGKTTSRRRTVTTGVASGKLKGKPLDSEQPTGLAKPSVAAARRSAVHAERAVSSRKELPLPTERSVGGEGHQGRSLRLQLRVEGERITVLDAIEVDVPAPVPDQVRGTDFLEVRSGDEVLALQRLIDPGVAIGIPDARDTKEFRGHREVVLEFVRAHRASATRGRRGARVPGASRSDREGRAAPLHPARDRGLQRPGDCCARVKADGDRPLGARFSAHAPRDHGKPGPRRPSGRRA